MIEVIVQRWTNLDPRLVCCRWALRGVYTPEEVQGLMNAGARPVGLGPIRFRVDTAAMAMLPAIMLRTG